MAGVASDDTPGQTPALLAALKASLCETVAMLPVGGGLPVDLALDLFAWKNAAYMAPRRRDDDLPPATGALPTPQI